MKCRFVDRESELKALDKTLDNKPSLAIVYGRRRIGKTRLLATWLSRLRGVDRVYYTAHLASHEQNLRLLSLRASQELEDPSIAQARYEGLTPLLDMLFSRHPDAVVVLDEFTYWARSSPQVVSELQEFVDHRLPHTSGVLVVTGSLVGVMERAILGGGAPLYARATTRMSLGELPYDSLRAFSPGLDPVERFKLFALLGGIPHYLCLASRYRSAFEALTSLFLESGAPLSDEPYLMLREEFREPTVYASILRAIAMGSDTPSKIAQATGLALPHLTIYISTLERLGYVRREVPLFHKRGSLRIADPILKTWFTVIEPVKDLAEASGLQRVEGELTRRLENLYARSWEEFVAKRMLELLAPQGYTMAGRLVHKGTELDVALVDPEGKRAIAIEVHWGDIGPKKAASLRKKAFSKANKLLPRGYKVEVALVATRGYKNGVKPPFIITPGDLEEGLGSLPFEGK